MRNRRPIFLLGFARGGTNLVLNLLRSHPEVCSPRGETHEVFRGKPTEPAAVRRAKRLRALPIRLLERRDVFDAGDWTPRPRLRALSRRWIDRILHAEKLRAREDGQNRWKAEGVEYTAEELARARLLCKNVNGLILCSRALAGIWPDASFVALVRDGRAVCEGQVRRGLTLAEAARRYEIGCRAIARDAEALPHYHVLRYEDLVASPQETLKRLYEAVDLELDAVPKLRLETKGVIDVDGVHRIVLGAGEKRLLWYDRNDFGRHLRRDANVNQLARLSDAEKEQIAVRCAWSLAHFGYA
jgi:hypothetical protein